MSNFASVPCSDPYDHLDAASWVDKQIEYGSQEFTVSGRGLLPYLLDMKSDLVGCEIGVCHGFTTEYLLKNAASIKKIYAVDNYPTFVDWNGTRITQERQQETKNRCYKKLSIYENRVIFAYEKSQIFVHNLSDESLDFVFIDGDHSYEATLSDCQLYWPKVKSGGLFAGHDINLTSVNNAVRQFVESNNLDFSSVVMLENNAWFIRKN